MFLVGAKKENWKKYNFTKEDKLWLPSKWRGKAVGNRAWNELLFNSKVESFRSK